MTEAELQTLREDVWLRMHDTQTQWDADMHTWRRVLFAHLLAMLSWWLLTFMQSWGF